MISGIRDKVYETWNKFLQGWFFSVLMYCICKKSYKVTKYIKLDYRILELEYRQYFVAHILEVE